MKHLDNIRITIHDDLSETNVSLTEFLSALRADVDMLRADVDRLEAENIETTNCLYEIQNRIDMLEQ